MNKFFKIIKTFFNKLTGKSKSTSKLDAINNFELEKFIGTWYEIVRYDHWFESGLRNVYTKYSLTETKNKIKVENFGIDSKTGKKKVITGKAKLNNLHHKNVGWLKVSFFGPFYNDYKIVYVDEKFNNIIVVGSTYDYFWILSKHQYIDSNDLVMLIDKATELGFDENKMIF
jgi:apolipoprotein D and lipocalin family protein